MQRVECKDGEKTWKIHISVKPILVTISPYLESSMGMEVAMCCNIWF